MAPERVHLCFLLTTCLLSTASSLTLLSLFGLFLRSLDAKYSQTERPLGNNALTSLPDRVFQGLVHLYTL